ncbi:bifunctional precorrin-2 dehydrogenase/sirohydrochlorin ferrochelatase [Tissierella praeacuta]|uniref:precorrin-2 dehydrogenase/sirohydrochlorin ferrochelatase family protein n=1 Tax=Tissierella praeacuta TaxID=43131 RepID=UPI0033419E25
MFYPIMVDISNKRIIVIGGGEVAHRKAKKFLEFGGKVIVLSPYNIHKFKELEERYKENLDFIYAEYNEKYIENAFLVIGATSSKEVNKQISKDCNKLNVLVNIVDSKEDSDFITPSIINNDTLTISISTMGSFPYLSKKIRMDMEDTYKKFNKEYLDTLEEIRYLILDKYREEKKEIMDHALNLNIDELKDLLMKLKD